jgi:hypothetical protein
MLLDSREHMNGLLVLSVRTRYDGVGMTLEDLVLTAEVI